MIIQDFTYNGLGKIIQDPLYQHRVIFLHGPLDEAVSEMRTLGVEEESIPLDKVGVIEGMVVDAPRCFILWVKAARNVPVLVHEIYHLVDEVFRFMGIEGDNDSEFGACLAEYYMREICNHLDGIDTGLSFMCESETEG